MANLYIYNSGNNNSNLYAGQSFILAYAAVQALLADNNPSSILHSVFLAQELQHASTAAAITAIIQQEGVTIYS
jgi:hypothetical protein